MSAFISYSNNNMAMKVVDIYIGIDDKARKIDKVYIGDDNNKARLVYRNRFTLNVGRTTNQSFRVIINNTNLTGWQKEPFSTTVAYGSTYRVEYSADNATPQYTFTASHGEAGIMNSDVNIGAKSAAATTRRYTVKLTQPQNATLTVNNSTATQTFNYGDIITIAVSPHSGYYLEYIDVNGAHIYSTPYKIAVVNNTNVSASIVLQNNGQGGGIC